MCEKFLPHAHRNLTRPHPTTHPHTSTPNPHTHPTPTHTLTCSVSESPSLPLSVPDLQKSTQHVNSVISVTSINTPFTQKLEPCTFPPARCISARKHKYLTTKGPQLGAYQTPRPPTESSPTTQAKDAQTHTHTKHTHTHSPSTHNQL